MNNQPHVHEIEITEYGSWWYVKYGDQYSVPSKPWLFPNLRSERRLRRTVESLIRKHDRESRRVPGRLSRQAELTRRVTPRLRNDRWGDEQL